MITDQIGKKIDNIASAYSRLRQRLAKPKKDKEGNVTRNAVRLKPLKHLRKTSSTILQRKHPQFVDLFLGHAAASMADRHYARYDQDGFDEAVMWLRDQLPIADNSG